MNFGGCAYAVIGRAFGYGYGYSYGVRECALNAQFLIRLILYPWVLISLMLGKALVSCDMGSKYLIIYSELLKDHLKEADLEKSCKYSKWKKEKRNQSSI